MKFMIDYGNGTVWSLLLPPNAVFWAATILAVLVVVYWHYRLKSKEIDFKQWEILQKNNQEQDTIKLFRKEKEENEKRAYN
jgi:hypothetical protein